MYMDVCRRQEIRAKFNQYLRVYADYNPEVLLILEIRRQARKQSGCIDKVELMAQR